MLESIFLSMLNREARSPRGGMEEIVGSLRVREGDAVADIGSGGGCFPLEFARRAGAASTVYAVDANTRNLAFVRRLSEQENLRNVVFVPAPGGEVDLPERGLDLIFARNVYHHLPEPARYFRRFRRFLKPGGRVAVVEHKPGCEEEAHAGDGAA